MDKKTMYIIAAAVVAVIVIAAAAIVMMQPKESSEPTFEGKEVAVDTVISAADIADLKTEAAKDSKYGLKISNSEYSVVFNNAAVKALADSPAKLTITPVKVSTLASDVSDTLGSNAKVFDIVFGDNVTFGENGVLTVTVDYKLASGESKDNLKVYYVTSGNYLTPCSDATYSNGKVTFTTTHLSVFAITAKSTGHYPVSVSTMMGGVYVTQTYLKAPEKVITYWNSNAELMCLFGLQDKVITAYTNGEYTCLNPELQSAYDALNHKSASSAPSVESVVIQEPDVIIGWSSTFGDKYLGTYDTWNARGVNCVATNKPAENVEAYLQLIKNIGIIFDMEDKAQEIIDNFNKSISAVQNTVKDIPQDQKVTALVIEPGYESGCYVYGSSYLSGDLITKAGGISLYDGGMKMLTFEQIASYSPEVIFIMSGSGSSPMALQEAIDKFTSIPGFKTMVDNARLIKAYGFYELYMGGVLSNTIIDRMFADMYPEVEPVEAYPVTVTTYDPTNKLTREQTFTETPKNVIAVEGGSLELLLTLGLGDYISHAYVKDNYVIANPDLMEAASKIKIEYRSAVNVEKFLTYSPDLIVGWSSSFKDTYAGSMDFWNERGVNCYVANAPNSDIEAVYNAVRNIGKIFNVEDRAEAYIASMEASIASIKEKTANISDSDKPTVLAIEVGYSGNAFCYGSSYITGKLIELAGAKSAYDGGMTKLTYEKIADLKPDVMLLVINSGDFRDEQNIQNLINELNSIEGFASIPAIVNQNIIHYGLYEVYMSGVIPVNILDRLYEDIYDAIDSGSIETNSIPVEKMDIPTDTLVKVFGNVNGDDSIDNADINSLKAILRGHIKQTYFADVNQDGVIDKADIAYLQAIIDKDSSVADKIYYLDVNSKVAYVSQPITTIGADYWPCMDAIVAIGAQDILTHVDSGIYSQLGNNQAKYNGFTQDKVTSFGSGFGEGYDFETIVATGVDAIVCGSAEIYFKGIESRFDDSTRIDMIRLPFWEGDQVDSAIITLAYLLNNDDYIAKAKEFLAFESKVTAALNAGLDKVTEKKTALVVYIGTATESSLEVEIEARGCGSFEWSVIAGLDNISSDINPNGILDSGSMYYTTTQEYVITKDPDYVFILGRTGFNRTTEDAQKSFNAGSEYLKTTKAYTSGQIWVSGAGVTSGSMQKVMSLLLASEVYEDQFKDVDAYALVQEFVDSFTLASSNGTFDVTSQGVWLYNPFEA